MPLRRKARLPAATKGTLVLDSGAITKVALADLFACSIVEDLSGRGWTVCIPAAALAEVITGRAKTDAPIERLIKQVGNTLDCGERLAKAAGVLRTKAVRRKKLPPSGIDAIVAAATVACQPSIVLTTDADDVGALLVAAELATVIRI
jgi:predicted nucleic acid-binding protein